MLPPKRVTSLLVSQANPVLSLVHKVLPDNLERYAVLTLLNTLANDFLQAGELEFLKCKVAKIEIKNIDVSWCFTLKTNEHTKDKLTILKQTPKQVDVTFSGELDAIILMASQKVDPDSLFFKRQLMITGDTELGLEIKNLIDQFDISLLKKPIRQALDIWSQHLLEQQHA